jgi:hypothetical protein
MKLAVAFVLGIVVGSVGFSGVAKILDRGVSVVQEQAREVAGPSKN